MKLKCDTHRKRVVVVNGTILHRADGVNCQDISKRDREVLRLGGRKYNSIPELLLESLMVDCGMKSVRVVTASRKNLASVAALRKKRARDGSPMFSPRG